MRTLRLRICVVAAAVLAAVILVRIVWVMSYNTDAARADRAARLSSAATDAGADACKGGIVISWCGMRGIVTLAAAFALPESLSVSRPHPAHGVRRGAGHAGDPGPDAAAADLGAAASRTTIRSARGRARPRRRLSRGARRDRRTTRRRKPKSCGSNTARMLLQRRERSRWRHRHGELPADPLRRRAIAAARQVDPRPARSRKRSATTRFTGSRRSSIAQN